jgi:rod shape determining protein RodA
MSSPLKRFFAETLSVDWMLFIPAFLISLAGLVTMDSFQGDTHYFSRQIIWLAIAVFVYFAATAVDWRFLRRTRVLVPLYLGVAALLALLFVLGHVSNGARSWFSLGGFAFQPSDLAKIVTILMLAKYFSRKIRTKMMSAYTPETTM